MLKPSFPVGFLHILLLVLLLAPGVHVALIWLTCSHSFRRVCCLWAASFGYVAFRKCMPQWTSNLDAILLDFGGLWAPICCPLAPSRSPKWLPTCCPKAILLPFATWLPFSLILAPFCCLLLPFSDYLGIIFRSLCLIASYTFFRFGVQVFA